MDRFSHYLNVSNGVFNALFDKNRTDIYHYTSPEVMKIIADKGTLRFSDRFYLNDKSEGYYILDLVNDNIADVIDDNSPLYGKRDLIAKKCMEYKEEFEQKDFKIYQVSFSLDKDSLCMWNYYTKGETIDGYNIHFYSDDLCNAIVFPDDEKKPHVLCGKVYYDEDTQIRLIKDFFVQYYNAIFEDRDRNIRHTMWDFENRMEMIIERLTLVGTFFKKPCFKIENEYRIALDLRIDENNIINLNKQRSFVLKHGLQAPYVDMNFDISAIKGLTLSPTLNFDNIDPELNVILNNRGLQGIPWTKSNIPVRY